MRRLDTPLRPAFPVIVVCDGFRLPNRYGLHRSLRAATPAGQVASGESVSLPGIVEWRAGWSGQRGGVESGVDTGVDSGVDSGVDIVWTSRYVD